MSFYRVVDHPVIQHKLSLLRNSKTESAIFRMILEEMSGFLAYEATRDLKVKNIEVKTPMEKTQTVQIGEGVILVSIMRAGNAMLEGMSKVLQFASIGHIGIYRDKFIDSTIEYYFRLPSVVAERKVIVVDPMLATGATAVAALDRLKQYGAGPIRFICILASKEGLAAIHEHHPDVEVICVSVERELNPKGYLLPGLGDAGDRIYGTLGGE